MFDFAVSSNHGIKVKGSEKKDKYLDLSRELEKVWNMKVTIIPIVSVAFGTVTTGILKRQEDFKVGEQVETIQTTTILRIARTPRRVSGDKRRLAVTHSPVKKHQLKLLRITPKK